eukprot:1646271-Amphidinium_carterae.1
MHKLDLNVLRKWSLPAKLCDTSHGGVEKPFQRVWQLAIELFPVHLHDTVAQVLHRVQEAKMALLDIGWAAFGAIWEGSTDLPQKLKDAKTAPKAIDYLSKIAQAASETKSAKTWNPMLLFMGTITERVSGATLALSCSQLLIASGSAGATG